MKRWSACAAGIAFWGATACVAAEVGAPIEVAPRAKDTRNQTWASAAWSEGGKCWLVVWREGYLNEQSADIWCARVSADGKALDPAGIRLTTSNWLKDRPRVASDGKGFLVVWEDMKNGKDWDIYGAIVSSGGNVGADKPLPLAVGENNQCRPDVAFAKGNYHVLWMAYEDGVYGIRGARVSPEGRVLGDKPVVVASVKATKVDNPVNVTLPVIAANSAGEVLSAFHVRDAYRMVYVARRPIDAATGEPGGSAPSAAGEKGAPSPGGRGWGGRERTAALAMGPDGAITVCSVETTRSPNDAIVSRLSKTGEVLKQHELGAGSLGIKDPFKPIAARFAAAVAGQSFLAVGEVLNTAGDPRRPGAERYARVIGWRITPDGAPDGEPFAIAGEMGKECVLPSVAAGPDGACLVVYSEIRGVDDVKVVGRVVK